MNIAAFHDYTKRVGIFRATWIAKYYGISEQVIKAWTTAVMATLKNKS